MTILQSLDRYHGRMAARGDVARDGHSPAPVGYAIVLSATGDVVDVMDLRDQATKKPSPRTMGVPSPRTRTSAPVANLLWDNTSYVLGRGPKAKAGEDAGKLATKVAKSHDAWRRANLDLVAGSGDHGLAALRAFIVAWDPGRFDSMPFRADMLGANVVFRVDGDLMYLHERPAALALVAGTGTGASGSGKDVIATTGNCLVDGTHAPAARLHPTIKGVWGAQTSGATLVSFNWPAATSFGRGNGENAPTSEDAARRYGAALNHLLRKGSANRLRYGIGDATVVYWADTSDAVPEAAAAGAEAYVSLFLDEPDAGDGTDLDAEGTAKLGDALAAAAAGRPLSDIDPGLAPGTRMHVLGLAPNNARLAVRFWVTDSLDGLASRLAAHRADLALTPPPARWGRAPSVARLLASATALKGEFGNVPHGLAGDVTRAVLDGAAYPRTLLSATLGRLRAGDGPGSGWHAAVAKAFVNRSIRLGVRMADPDRDDGFPPLPAHVIQEMLPVALDPSREDVPYQLGRLFCILESAQYAALGRVNAPIGDRYYAAASSTPARIFGPLLRGLKAHVATARKLGRGGWIEPKVAEVMAMLPPDLPRTLRLEDQGRFAVGYYHERATRPAKAADTATGPAGDGPDGTTAPARPETENTDTEEGDKA